MKCMCTQTRLSSERAGYCHISEGNDWLKSEKHVSLDPGLNPWLCVLQSIPLINHITLDFLFTHSITQPIQHTQKTYTHKKHSCSITTSHQHFSNNQPLTFQHITILYRSTMFQHLCTKSKFCSNHSASVHKPHCTKNTLHDIPHKTKWGNRGSKVGG